MTRRTLASAAALAALGWAAAAGGQRPQAAPASRPDLIFRGVRFWDFKGSHLSASGTSDQVAYEKASGLVRAHGVQATHQPTRPGELPADVAAGDAVGQLQSRDADASNGVRLTRLDGSATTESAHYSSAQHLVSGTQPVGAVTPRFAVHGQSFTLDTESEQAEIDGPVHGKGRVSR